MLVRAMAQPGEAMRPRATFKWLCPKCQEPQFGAESKLCPACLMETRGHWHAGKRHVWTTQGNLQKGDTGLGRQA